MKEPLRIVLLEDRAEDAELVMYEMRRGKVDAEFHRVENEEEFTAALRDFAPDVILADYHLPFFDGLAALRLLRASGSEIPFIFVSGSIGEDRAVETLREGATDYVSKDRPGRLPVAVLRAVAEARARDERRRVTRDLGLILESTSDGICTIDGDGTLMLANGAAARILGNDSARLLGMGVHEAFHSVPPNAVMHPASDCRIRRVLATREAVEGVEDVFWRRDGTSVVVAVSASPIVDRGSMQGIVVTFRDVTQQKLLESQLEQASRLSSLGRLSATIAHEVNNVLMSIQPFAEVIRATSESARVQHATEEIFRGIQRGKQIAQEILRFGKPAELSPVAIDVGEWLASFAEEARGLAGPTVEVEVVPPPQRLAVLADPVQFHQVFLNLVTNARDAMPAGGTLSIKARRLEKHSSTVLGGIVEAERFIHFVVSDTGEGMPREVIRQIFDPLFTTKKSGTGIGLTVTHQIVTRHQGQILVESTVGKGTTFHLFFPLAEVRACEADPPRLARMKNDE